MKRKMNVKCNLALILTAAMSAFMLAGCGTKGAFEVDQADAIVTISKNGSDVTVSVENPWITTDKDGVIEATGLNIYTPEEATNVQYSYLITSNMAQVTFTYNSHDEWTFRKQKTDMFIDISGMYYEWGYQDSSKISGKDAMVYAYVEGADDSGTIDDLFGVQLVNWYDDSTGISYSLSVSGKDLNGMDIEVIAENLFALENNN